MKELKGVLFFWKNEAHATGYLVVGKDHYQLTAVRRSPIRTEFTGHKIEAADGSGTEGESERDPA
jgi:hypothetical protein